MGAATSRACRRGVLHLANYASGAEVEMTNTIKQENEIEIAPIDEAIDDLRWALEELEHTRSDDDYDRVMKELVAIGRLADSMLPAD
jgi:hypothetical protein